VMDPRLPLTPTKLKLLNAGYKLSRNPVISEREKTRMVVVNLVGGSSHGTILHMMQVKNRFYKNLAKQVGISNSNMRKVKRVPSIIRASSTSKIGLQPVLFKRSSLHVHTWLQLLTLKPQFVTVVKPIPVFPDPGLVDLSQVKVNGLISSNVKKLSMMEEEWLNCMRLLSPTPLDMDVVSENI